MTRNESIIKTLAGLSVGLLAVTICSPVLCADRSTRLPANAPEPSPYKWTGFYMGGHVGYGGGSFGPTTNPLPEQGVFFPPSPTGLIGGYQSGYNFQLLNRIVLGVEADVSFTSPLDRPRLQPSPFNTTFDYFATGRGRVGYAYGRLLPYVTGGFAWAQTHVNLNASDGSIVSTRAHTHLGWTAGAGIEYAVSGNWSAKAEYNYINLERRRYDLGDVGLPNVNVDPNIHIVKIGLNTLAEVAIHRGVDDFPERVLQALHHRGSIDSPLLGRGAFPVRHARNLDRILAEHFHATRHRANLVVAFLAADLNQEVALRQIIHRLVEAADRPRDRMREEEAEEGRQYQHTTRSDQDRIAHVGERRHDLVFADRGHKCPVDAAEAHRHSRSEHLHAAVAGGLPKA